ncbi:FUSC family protein [Bacillus horti]|uniref:Uncharacterized membrane protein YgaE (UPF0421/DUF939 family) n=1 Tax=Caldalkalibacillus horti TaxID=77523 RepID=A0ABT9W1E1_9BACI|nr:aromatic acid exporter family protein [Bacillus horti]MDQ0167076.1 uncharacterized membrane protein YgaE (UPF0421/DUF939 family) [Bacillus horti]
MKLGARIIKTGIAVCLSLYIAALLQLEPIVFAALASVLAIQPSLYRSWQNIVDQLQANTIGAVLAIMFAYFLGNDPFVVGLVVIIVIAINLQLRFEKSITLSVVTVIAIMESVQADFLMFAFDRFLLILIGIGASAVVNVLFLPPKYEDRLYSQIQEANNSLLTYLRASSMNEFDDKTYRAESKRLKEELSQLEHTYSLYKEERTYFRKMKYTKTRKLVLFRKMLQTTNKALYLFKQLERNQPALAMLPEQLQQLIKEEIDLLTNYQEKIFLKYEGKLKIKHPHVPEPQVLLGRQQVLEKFIKEYQEKDSSLEERWIHMFPAIAAIIDYYHELERLDKLVEGYHSFHAEDSEK